MSIEDATIEIPSAPQPSSMAWLGGMAVAAGLSWLVTLVTVFAIGPMAGHLVAAGLCVSVTASITAVSVWMRLSLAKAASDHHLQIALLLAGQHALLMAETRRMRREIDQADRQAAAERREFNTKLAGLIERMPTYWHGFADAVQPDGNVMDIFRGPRR